MVSRILNKFKKRVIFKSIVVMSFENKKGHISGLYKKENDFSYENLQFFIIENKRVGKEKIEHYPYTSYIPGRIVYKGKLTNLVKAIYNINV